VNRVRPLTTVAVLVAVLVGTGVWWAFFRGPSKADCAPVRDLLSFNKTQIEALNAKTHIPAPGSYEKETDPTELDYRVWSDGLADRAAKVSAPDLAGPARDAAQTADRLVRARLDYDAQSARTAPGAQPPAAAMVVTAFNDQFEGQIRALATTCPA
jgi:hypothetical protein